MNAPQDVFEEYYQEYQTKLLNVDFDSIKNIIGIYQENDKWYIPFFNNKIFVSRQGLMNESGEMPNYGISVILFKYILLCPDEPHYDAEWTSFKDFKKVSHFTNVNFFSSDTEKLLEKTFSGKLDELRKACTVLEGIHHEMETPYDCSMMFNALPRISLLLLFNDGDEEFPAKCTVLFQKHSEYYLDPESLAMTSAWLAKSLKRQI